MQRGQGAILLFFGLVFLVVSVYGLSLLSLLNLQSYEVYTKVDPNNHISYSAGVITQQVSRIEGAYLYFDKGANYFTGSFTHTLDFEVTSAVQYSIGVVWMLSNSIGDSFGLRGTAFVEALWTASSPSSVSFIFRDWSQTSGAALPYSTKDTSGLSIGQKYYLTITCSGGGMTCSIYSDSARSTPVAQLAITLPSDGTSFRYIYASSSEHDEGVDATHAYVGTQIVEGLDLGTTGNQSGGQGTLRVFCSYQGNYVAVSVTVTSPTMSAAQTGTTTTDGSSPLSFSNLAAGSYTVSGTYSGNYEVSTVTVSGVTVDTTLNFGGSGPSPSPEQNNQSSTPPDILGLITRFVTAFLGDSTIQALLFLLGLVLSGVGSIVLVLPTKKQSLS